MMTMNSELFNSLAIEGSEPVLVEFWAPWCSYCRRIESAMEASSEQFKDRLVVAQVNIDAEPLLAKKEKIEVIPALVMYRGGKALGSIVAPESKAEIDEFIRENLGA